MLDSGSGIIRVVALLEEMWPCWKTSVTVEDELFRPSFYSPVTQSSGCLQNKMSSSELLQRYVCLDAAMLPALLIMD